MGREIRFRAWDKELKKMFSVVALNFSHDVVTLNNEYPKKIIKNQPSWINKALKKVNLMQYAGLKDKNGKEIYEGDILKYQYLNDEIDYVVFNETGQFSYNKSHIYITNEDEIIGNIYENPELMEVEK